MWSPQLRRRELLALVIAASLYGGHKMNLKEDTKTGIEQPIYSEKPIRIHVDPSVGDDSGPGTENKPLASFQEALNRLPLFIFHSTRIYLHDGEYVHDPSSIESRIHTVTFQKGLSGEGEPFKIVGNPSDPSKVVLSNTGYINLSIKGTVPYRTVVEGVQFEGILQNYNGTFSVQNCRFNGSVENVNGLDGYAGFSMLEDCWFGGSVKRAIYANQGHRIHVENCSGSVDEVYATNAMGEVNYLGDNIISSNNG